MVDIRDIFDGTAEPEPTQELRALMGDFHLRHPHVAGLASMTVKNSILPSILGLALIVLAMWLAILATAPRAHATEDNDPKQNPACWTRFSIQEVNPADAEWTELSDLQMLVVRAMLGPVPPEVVTMMIGKVGDAYKLYGFKADGCRHGGMRISPESVRMIFGAGA